MVAAKRQCLYLGAGLASWLAAKYGDNALRYGRTATTPCGMKRHEEIVNEESEAGVEYIDYMAMGM